MKLDNVMIRMTAVMGHEWLMAYALLDLEPDVDIDKLRFDMPNRLTYHHETEKYVGGVPGDLFVGFFARGQTELFNEIGKFKTMKEVRSVKDWAIANFPVAKPDLTKLDWRIIKSFRGGAEKTAAVIADELKEDVGKVKERIDFIKNLPLAFAIEPPNSDPWTFTEIGLNFYGTTFQEKAEELMKWGKPFGATCARKQAAIMAQPQTVEELTEIIKNVRKIPGVAVTDISFCEDMIWSQPWLDKFIDERIEEAD